MSLTNLDFIHFCQNLLGAPYWYNASAIKATKHAFKVNAIRFPKEYEKLSIENYQQHIDDKEIVTDTIGLIKGFAWTDGGKEILEARGTDKIINAQYGLNGCPDKTPNGLFTWASSQNAKWGPINTLPEVPGLVITLNGHLAIYEGNGYVIDINEEKGYLDRMPIENNPWQFWYEIPFITYLNKVEAKSEEIEEAQFILELNGIAIAIKDVLFREAPNEDAKFLDIIAEKEKVKVYNDSNQKWLHIVRENGQEGYALIDFFLYFPKAPNIISPEYPEEIKEELRGDYQIISNISLKNSGKAKANNYVVLPKEIIVSCTGGITNNKLHVYAELNNRCYVGYIDKRYVRKVEENGNCEEKEDEKEEV